jgi:hypothetical protein
MLTRINLQKSSVRDAKITTTETKYSMARWLSLEQLQGFKTSKTQTSYPYNDELSENLRAQYI